MNEYILELGKKAKEASKKLAIIDTNTKNAVLTAVAKALIEKRELIKAENKKDLEYVKEKGKITNREYQDISKISERTATRDLLDLVVKNIFVQVGSTGKGTNYILKTPWRRQTRHKEAIKTPGGIKTMISKWSGNKSND